VIGYESPCPGSFFRIRSGRALSMQADALLAFLKNAESGMGVLMCGVFAKMAEVMS
jgi:hypothetical protein